MFIFNFAADIQPQNDLKNRFCFHVGARRLRPLARSDYYDCWPWIANCRTSIGIFVGMPPGPGAVEIRAAIS